MASVRTFHLPHYHAYPVHVALFEHVQNAGFLKRQLLAAHPDFDYAFLDASTVLSPSHILTSAFLTLHAFSAPSSRPKTRSPHAELVFRLSPTNNIAHAYSLFGISAATTALVAVKLGVRLVHDEEGADGGRAWALAVDEGVTAESVARHLGGVVEGRSVRMGEAGVELGQGCDVEKVCGVYKVGGMGERARGVHGRKELESVILGMMSLKGS